MTNWLPCNKTTTSCRTKTIASANFLTGNKLNAWDMSSLVLHVYTELLSRAFIQNVLPSIRSRLTECKTHWQILNLLTETSTSNKPILVSNSRLYYPVTFERALEQYFCSFLVPHRLVKLPVNVIASVYSELVAYAHSNHKWQLGFIKNRSRSVSAISSLFALCTEEPFQTSEKSCWVVLALCHLIHTRKNAAHTPKYIIDMPPYFVYLSTKFSTPQSCLLKYWLSKLQFSTFSNFCSPGLESLHLEKSIKLV